MLCQEPGEATEFTIISVAYSLRAKRHSVEYTRKRITNLKLQTKTENRQETNHYKIEKPIHFRPKIEAAFGTLMLLHFSRVCYLRLGSCPFTLQ